MFDKLVQIFKISDLRKKIIFVLLMLAIFRVIAAIPIPGIDLQKLKSFFESNQFFGLLNIFSGGGLSNLSIVMLGVAPYITASIIMQLLTMIFPKFKEMYHEDGEAGKRKFNQYSRLLTIPLAALQAYGFLRLFMSQGVIGYLSVKQMTTDIIIVVAGTILLMWIGELISEKGIGNGVSIIIFAGIVSGIPTTISQTVFAYDSSQLLTYLILLVLSILVISGVVAMTEAERKIPINYAKRVRGFRMYGGVSTHLPLRVNQAGVMPIIFALSILLFPEMVTNIISGVTSSESIQNIFESFILFFRNPVIYDSLYFILVVFFTYFYTAITFDPKSISENIQKQGGYIPGIRPGRQTAEFMYKVLNRITLVGALFLGVIAVLPFLIKGATGLTTISLGGTALLIVVSVVLDITKQIDAQLVMREYEGV